MFVSQSGYASQYHGREFQSDVFLPDATDAESNADGTTATSKVLRRTKRVWTPTPPPTPDAVPDLDARVSSETNYLEKLAKSTQTVFQYDSFNNVTHPMWTDFDGAVKRTKATQFKSDYADAPVHLRRLPNR